MTAWATGDVLTAAFLNAIPRANLAEEGFNYPVPLTQWRYANGNTLDATGAAGNPKIVMGGWGSGTGILQGEDAHGATKTETVCFDFVLPAEYKAGSDIYFFISGRVYDTGTGTISAKTIDVEAYEINDYGAAGADLCVDAAQNIDTTMQSYIFGITATNLAPCDRLRILARITITESGGTGSQYAQFGGALFSLTVRG
jgi:hypothetical protein